jgi:LuxR family transcriptional regulator, maltose regulon positive regulatory protein
MRETLRMSGDMKTLSGVTISRTHVPTLPPGYLARKHLFPLLDNSASGTTFVIAPAGYGKSALVAQWAQGKKVIWMTVAEADSLNEMSAMMIAATRNLIPSFGQWFEREQPMRPTEVVRRWGNELLQHNEDFVFVLDNLRTENSADVAIENRLIEQFPSNVHFIVIRKEALESIYAICASRGPVKTLTIEDLRFSQEEIDSLVQNAEPKLDEKSREILNSAQGWPSATSLLLEHLQGKSFDLDITRLMSSHAEPLRELALFVLSNLDSKVIKTVETLSVVEVFNYELAEFLLGKDYSFDLITAIAIKGEIFTPSRQNNQSFVFSPMIREVLLERMRTKPEIKENLHQRLIDFFEKRRDVPQAIEHAFQAGNAAKIAELFPDAARMKQAQGLGGDLVRWSEFAALNPDEGYLKSLTVKIVGLLVNLDFSAVKIESERLAAGAQKSPAKEFYLQYLAGISSYINASVGNFSEVEENVQRALYESPTCYLGIDDRINLLRVLATCHYIFDDAEKVEEIAVSVKRMNHETLLPTSHAFALSIEAMALHQRGEYRSAYEMASMVLIECKKNGFVGVHGPLDAMYVKARCLLEFSQHQEGIILLEEVRHLAYQWKQWHWYLAADNHLIQDLCINHRQTEAIERIRSSRELIASFQFSNSLSGIIDLNEMFIRKNLKDYDRLEQLIARAPKTRHAQQMQQEVDEHRNRKKSLLDAKSLPYRTPREQIWKHLTEASLNIDSENVAINELQKALKIASQVGAKETFLRQDNELGNLILKIANENPTVYNEELASAMATRMRDRGSTMTEGRPTLTKRELEILRQLSTGRTLTVIAGELHISQNTMKTHLKNLYRKMEVEGRKGAVEKATSLFLL